MPTIHLQHSASGHYPWGLCRRCRASVGGLARPRKEDVEGVSARAGSQVTTNLSEIRIEPVRASRLPGVDLANVPFSSVFSDHMFVAEYRDGAWRQATIRAYGPLALAPSVSATGRAADRYGWLVRV